MNRPTILLLVYSAASVALLLLGGWLTYLGLGDWYYQLEFPPFQAPSWLFTPVWTLVLSLLAVSTWFVAKESSSKPVACAHALTLYGAQCVLNVGWSLLFFTLARPDIALWGLIVLDVVLALMILTYGQISKAAGLMLVPYLAWLILATAINGWIVQINPPFA